MKSISRAIELLMLFTDAQKPLSVTDLAERSGLHKSSVSRILATLEASRFVERDPDSGRFSIGLGILSLAGQAISRFQLPAAARLALEHLARSSGETVTVSGWDGVQAVNLDQILGPEAITNFSPPGRVNPPHCTATGKVFLAHLETSLRDRLLAKPLKRYTERTITSRAALLAQLEEVKHDGYAINDEEFIPHVFSIASPVLSAKGRVLYAVAITLPNFRCDEKKKAELIRAVRDTSAELSTRTGHAS